MFNNFFHLKTILAACLMLTTSEAYSYSVDKTPVEYLRTYKTYAIATLTNEAANPNGCTMTYKDYGAGRYIAVEFDSTEGKEMYSALLAAYLSGSEVAFGAHDGQCKVWSEDNTIPIAYRIDIIR
ncbi:hypothetical protein BTJ40_05375 [Microbulbifer sp. A4B17]|uniref:hypothetical protein n=1 Tax=Microbulbifer sp. A4B17 TaxID=359370 RepID=UPI000D52C8CF|nr:hypothetical protein [Microbulbifer sp. A4B17]AWF80287.1 hypothetical protein BTJ40_05375 [Microbulbifer sp. A4B17]